MLTTPGRGLLLGRELQARASVLRGDGRVGDMQQVLTGRLLDEALYPRQRPGALHRRFDRGFCMDPDEPRRLLGRRFSCSRGGLGFSDRESILSRTSLIPMRGQECKNAGRPLLERSGLPEPLHQETFKLGCSRYRHAMAIVSTHILKVFADGGPGEGAFFKKLLPPGNLIRSKAHR